jgi:hypothetical protein
LSYGANLDIILKLNKYSINLFNLLT